MKLPQLFSLMGATGCLLTSANAQLITGRTLAEEGGGVRNLILETVNGQSSIVETGLPDATLPAVSRNGRFIYFTSPEPNRPNQTSTDVYRFDRIDRTSELVLNFETSLDQPTGAFATRFPLYKAPTPDDQWLALVSQVSTSDAGGGGSARRLELYRTNDQSNNRIAKFGLGNQVDFLSLEFSGLSWSPDGTRLITSSYVPVGITQQGQTQSSQGIVEFVFDGNSISESRIITRPPDWQAFSIEQGAISQSAQDIQPAWSPSGAKIAFFRVLTRTFNALAIPSEAALMTVNADGSGLQTIVTFAEGLFPAGVTWSADGSTLLFSIGDQGNFRGEPTQTVNLTTTQMRAIPFEGGEIVTVNGNPSGYIPTTVKTAPPVIGEPDLRTLSPNLIANGTDDLALQVTGLNPTTSYRILSGNTLSPGGMTFSGMTASGAELGGGVSLTQSGPKRFFAIER